MDVNFIYQNVRGLRTKSKTVYQNAALLDCDLFLLTETWLTSSFNSQSFFPLNYTVERTDRSLPGLVRGGGVLAAIRNNLQYRRRRDLEGEAECVWIELISNHNPVFIGVHYFPNHFSGAKLSAYFDFLCDVLPGNVPIIFLGDFNCPEYSKPTLTRSAMLNHLCNFVSLFNLMQVNDICNTHGNLLDLVFCNFDVTVRSSLECIVPEDVYHPTLEGSFRCTSASGGHRPPSSRMLGSRNYSGGDYLSLHNYFYHYDWDSVTAVEDIDAAALSFTSVVQDGLNRFIPRRPKRTKPRFPYWFSPLLRRYLKLKKSYHRRFKKFGKRYYYNIFSIFRRLSKRQLLVDTVVHNSSIGESLRQDPSKFWKHASRLRGSRSQIDVLHSGGRTVTDPKVISGLFADFFQSSFTPSSAVTAAPPVSSQPISPLISNEVVASSIRCLRSSLSSGPDSIPSIIVKAYSEIFVPVLALLFNRSIQCGIFPAVWNTARVIPLLKAGDATDVGNYRPISLSNCFSKVFEKSVLAVITPVIEPVLVPDQHGFRSGRSTTTNLYSFLSFSAPLLEVGSQVDTIYLDWSKAFDKVPHDRLLAKLSAFPGLEPYIPWFRNYLARRCCAVCVNGATSEPYWPTSGVHQGSNLGPTLFNIFINDVGEGLSCRFLMFADDIKIFGRVGSVLDALALQRDLDSLVEWGRVNNMHLNVSKCSVVSFGRGRNGISFGYRLEGVLLARLSEVRDLGVVFQDTLKFSSMVSVMVPKALRLLGMIRMFSRGLSLDCFLTLYKALVRPLLEYGVPIWNRLTSGDSSRIERVQRVFVRTAYCRYFGRQYFYSYAYISELLALPSLSQRRLGFELNFFFKVLRSDIVLPISLDQVSILPEDRRRNRLFFYRYRGGLLSLVRVACLLNSKSADPMLRDRFLSLSIGEGSVHVNDLLNLVFGSTW